MTDKIQNNKIHYLYKIINKINGKIYIGQTVQPNKRWNQHCNDAKNPTQIIHHAIIKYGIENFEFEVIACCKTQEDANETETLLVSQYDSFVKNGKGYNATYGGMNAPKTEAWKQAWHKWWDNLTQEEKAEINFKKSISFTKYLEEYGHPAQGYQWTDESKTKLSSSLKALDKDKIYTDEVRQHMSESHIGNVDSEETKQKKSEKATLSWDKRNIERLATGELKCNAPGCEINGISVYLIVNGIRYCQKHGLRLKRTGFLELQPRSSHNKGKKTSEENRKKLLGRKPHNKIIFTEEQISKILLDNRSNRKIAKDFDVTEKVIKRIKSENHLI